MPNVPNYSFNAQTSYSPLLAQLAQAPVEKAKLDILMQQNQREKLSQLLKNMSEISSAIRNAQMMRSQSLQNQASASQLQGRNQLIDQIRNANQPEQGPTPSGQSMGTLSQQPGFADQMKANIAQADPGAYAAAMGQYPAMFSGIDLASGVSGNEQTGTNRQKESTMNRIFPLGYKESVNPDTELRELVSNIPGVKSLPVDQQPSGKLDLESGTVIGGSPNQQLPPGWRKQLEARGKVLDNEKQDFLKLPKVMQTIDALDAADELKNLVNGNVPVAQFDAKAFMTRIGKISRITQTEIENNNGNPGVWNRTVQRLNTAAGKGWTPENIKEINQMATILDQTNARALLKTAQSHVQSNMNSNPQYGKAHNEVIQPLIQDYAQRIDPNFNFKDPFGEKVKNNTGIGTHFNGEKVLKIEKIK